MTRPNPRHRRRRPQPSALTTMAVAGSAGALLLGAFSPPAATFATWFDVETVDFPSIRVAGQEETRLDEKTDLDGEALQLCYPNTPGAFIPMGFRRTLTPWMEPGQKLRVYIDVSNWRLLQDPVWTFDFAVRSGEAPAVPVSLLHGSFYTFVLTVDDGVEVAGVPVIRVENGVPITLYMNFSRAPGGGGHSHSIPQHGYAIRIVHQHLHGPAVEGVADLFWRSEMMPGFYHSQGNTRTYCEDGTESHQFDYGVTRSNYHVPPPSGARFAVLPEPVALDVPDPVRIVPGPDPDPEPNLLADTEPQPGPAEAPVLDGTREEAGLSEPSREPELEPVEGEPERDADAEGEPIEAEPYADGDEPGPGAEQ